VSVFERYEGKTPDRATCDAIARAFTRSPVRNPRHRVAAPPADEAPRAKHARAPANVPRSTPSSPFVSLLGTTFHIPTASAAPVRIPSGDARLDARISPLQPLTAEEASPGGERDQLFGEEDGGVGSHLGVGSNLFGARHLPGALDDVIMLDSESPMFPSCVWSDPTPAYPTPAIFDDDVEDGRARDDENTKREDENVPSASSDGGASGGGDEWDVRPRALEREERGERHPDASLRPEAEASLARSYSLASLPLEIDDATRRDAAAVAKRDIAEWQPAGTSLYVGARANAFAFARPRRPSSPSPPPPPPEAATPVPYLPEQPNVLASEDSAAEVAAEMAAVARVSALAGGGAFRARELAPLRWSELAFGPTQSPARDEDDGARGFDALSEGDDVERSIKLSDELSDEDEESVDVRPYAPGVSLEGLVRARDDDLTATLARGGRTGRWVPLRPSGGIGAARVAGEEDAGATYDEDAGATYDEDAGATYDEDAGATYNAAMVASAVEELGDGEAHPVAWKQIKTWFENRRMTQKRAREGGRPVRRNNGGAGAGKRAPPSSSAGAASKKTASRKKTSNATARRSIDGASRPVEGSGHGVKRGRRWSSFGSVDFDADVDAAADAAAAAAAELRARDEAWGEPSSALTRDMSWADIHAALTNAGRR